MGAVLEAIRSAVEKATSDTGAEGASVWRASTIAGTWRVWKKADRVLLNVTLMGFIPIISIYALR